MEMSKVNNSTMNESAAVAEKITVRRQKVVKNYTKQKMIFFGILLAVLLLVAAFAPYLTPYDPYEQDLAVALQPPSASHLLGTDRYGRDMLSRVIMGSQMSVYSALLLVVVITVVGGAVGIICGYCGGKLDSFLMRVSDIFLAFPGMVFAIAVASVMTGGIMNAVVALAFISWPKYARIARSQVMTIKNTPYMAAAKLAGSNPVKVILKHIVPNIAGPVIVTSVLDIGTMMMEIAGLSFLGLGATPPAAEWGSMMSNGRSMLQTTPWVVLAPGCAIFLTVVIFNLFGDTVRDVLDPRQRRREG